MMSTSCNNLLPPNPTITLVTHDHRIPLPSPLLLGVHATITEILHMSGMADYIDKIYEECRSIRCLASDGDTDLQALFMIC